MISFYPGPSQLNQGVESYIQEALESGILSYNHRQKEFTEVVFQTCMALRTMLQIPNEYEIYFVNSATECWYISAYSLVAKTIAHFHNGSFGERWQQVSESLNLEIESFPYHFSEELPLQQANKAELICLTHGETSNGAMIDHKQLALFRSLNPDKLIAVDATSSMGGVYLDFKLADVWFASIQKCFGLPSGLGILICSPLAVAKAKKLNSRNYFHNIANLHERAIDFQTCNTPNMLGIYLLGKIAQHSESIQLINKKLIMQSEHWQVFFKENPHLELSQLNSEKRLSSPTIIVMQGDPNKIVKIKEIALKHNFLLGNGYGKWAKNTFRIANFPAHSTEHISGLMNFFKTYSW